MYDQLFIALGNFFSALIKSSTHVFWTHEAPHLIENAAKSKDKFNLKDVGDVFCIAGLMVIGVFILLCSCGLFTIICATYDLYISPK